MDASELPHPMILRTQKNACSRGRTCVFYSVMKFPFAILQSSPKLRASIPRFQRSGSPYELRSKSTISAIKRGVIRSSKPTNSSFGSRPRKESRPSRARIPPRRTEERSRGSSFSERGEYPGNSQYALRSRRLPRGQMGNEFGEMSKAFGGSRRDTRAQSRERPKHGGLSMLESFPTYSDKLQTLPISTMIPSPGVHSMVQLQRLPRIWGKRTSLLQGRLPEDRKVVFGKCLYRFLIPRLTPSFYTVMLSLLPC